MKVGYNGELFKKEALQSTDTFLLLGVFIHAMAFPEG